MSSEEFTIASPRQLALYPVDMELREPKLARPRRDIASDPLNEPALPGVKIETHFRFPIVRVIGGNRALGEVPLPRPESIKEIVPLFLGEELPEDKHQDGEVSLLILYL